MKNFVWDNNFVKITYWPHVLFSDMLFVGSLVFSCYSLKLSFSLCSISFLFHFRGKVLDSVTYRLNIITTIFLLFGAAHGTSLLVSAFISLIQAGADCSINYTYYTDCHEDQLDFQSDFPPLICYALFFFFYPIWTLYTGLFLLNCFISHMMALQGI